GQDTRDARPARQQATARPSTPLLIGLGAGAGVVLLGLIVTIVALARSGTPKPDSPPVVQEKGREEKKDPPGIEPPRSVEPNPPIGPGRVPPAIGRVAFRGHPAAIRSLVLSSDGARAASGGADGTLLVWDLTGRQPLFHHKHTSDLRGLAFSPDSRRVL